MWLSKLFKGEGMADSIDDVRGGTEEDRKKYKNIVYKKNVTKEELKDVIYQLDGILLKTADLKPDNSFRVELEYIRLCAARKVDEVAQDERRCADRVHQYLQIVLNAGLAIAVAVVLFKVGIKS